jgi:hypothetical protein
LPSFWRSRPGSDEDARCLHAILFLHLSDAIAGR